MALGPPYIRRSKWRALGIAPITLNAQGGFPQQGGRIALVHHRLAGRPLLVLYHIYGVAPSGTTLQQRADENGKNAEHKLVTILNLGHRPHIAAIYGLLLDVRGVPDGQRQEKCGMRSAIRL